MEKIITKLTEVAMGEKNINININVSELAKMVLPVVVSFKSFIEGIDAYSDNMQTLDANEMTVNEMFAAAGGFYNVIITNLGNIAATGVTNITGNPNSTGTEIKEQFPEFVAKMKNIIVVCDNDGVVQKSIEM